MRVAKRPTAARPRPNDSLQVFFSGAPMGVRPSDVEDVFSKYGKIADIDLFIDQRTRQSRGVGLVAFEELAEAEAAIAALNNTATFPGGYAAGWCYCGRPQQEPNPR